MRALQRHTCPKTACSRDTYAARILITQTSDLNSPLIIFNRISSHLCNQLHMRLFVFIILGSDLLRYEHLLQQQRQPGSRSLE